MDQLKTQILSKRFFFQPIDSADLTQLQMTNVSLYSTTPFSRNNKFVI